MISNNLFTKKLRVSQVRLTISSSDENEIPLWIIIVAASGAILLLLIITLICLKCGIFKNADEHEIMTHTVSLFHLNKIVQNFTY